jgi:hypothetical protein
MLQWKADAETLRQPNHHSVGRGFPRLISPNCEGFALTLTVATSTLNLGFLTILQETGGYVGGYLVTNQWGRPLEFRLSTAVQPNRVQAVLYGPTLRDYIHADVIGKTLVDKTTVKPDVIVTDSPGVLGLRDRVEIAVVAIRTDDAFLPPDTHAIVHARCSAGLLIGAKFGAEAASVIAKLDAVDAAVDLAEPFARIREAVEEAHKSARA